MKLLQLLGGRVRSVDVTVPYVVKVTTAADGTATIDLTAAGFTAVPSIQLTCKQGSTTQGTFAEYVTVTATSVSIKSWRTVGTLIIGGSAVAAASAVVEVWASPYS